MPIRDELAEFESIESLNGMTGEFVAPTPGETFSAASGIALREEVSNASDMNYNRAKYPRNRYIDSAIDAGDIPEGVIQANTIVGVGVEDQLNYSALAEWMQNNGHTRQDVPSDFDIEVDMRETLKQQREKDRAILDRAEGFKAKAAAFAGTGATVMFADPINLLSMALPLSQVNAGRTVFQNTLRVGGSAAVGAVAAETAVQAYVFDYKKDIASPYEWTDAVFNIGAAGVFSGVLAGALGGASSYFKKGNAADAAARLDQLVAELESKAAPVPAVRQAGDSQVQVAAPGVNDTAGTVRTSAGTEVAYQWEVVDAADLKTSDAADFDATLQPRDRAKAEMRGQVDEIAAKLDPESLGASRGAESGAPIIGPDGTVESGNGRVMALRRAKEKYKDNFNAYREFIKRTTGQDVDGFETPILVRRRTTEMSPEELRQFTIEANKGAQASFDAAEVARADAALLSDDVIALYEGGDVSLERNAPFVARVLDAMPAGERNALSSDGRITPEGVTRLRNMLMSRAYSGTEEGDRLLKSLAVSSDDNARAISGALHDVAGRISQLRATVAGTADEAFDIGDKVIEALSVVQQLRKQKTPVSEWLQQSDLLTSRDDVVDGLVRIFFDEGLSRGVSRQKVAGALDAYIDLAYSRMGTEDLFGGGSKPADLLDEARGMAQQIDVDVARLAEARVAAERAKRFALDESPDVTPKDMAEVDAKYEAIEGRGGTMETEAGTVSVEEYVAEAELRAKKAEEIITCMLGAA